MKYYFVALLSCLVTIYGINSYIDVSGLDTYQQVVALTQRQGQGDLLAWEQLFDQRAWIKEKLAASRTCPEILVLGSSTLGGLSQDMLPDRTIVNGWLSSPSFEDFEAITEILRNASCRPKTILLGTDPWLFNSRVRDLRWLSLLEDYRLYHGAWHWRDVAFAAELPRKYWATFKERLNYVTTRESLKLLLMTLHDPESASRRRAGPELVHESPEAYCKTIPSDYYIRANDGHFVTCPQFLLSVDQVENIAAKYVVNNTHQIADWPYVDQGRLSILRQLVKDWKAMDIRVILVAPPYHPITYQKLLANQSIRSNLFTLDDQLNKIAYDESISFVNLRDPSSLGCTAEEFSDSHHFRASCFIKMMRLLDVVLARRPIE